VLGQPAGFVGALAAASADTWATELGLLSSGQPKLITTLQTVPAGTSGGITPAGLAASLGGAMIVGIAWAALGGPGWWRAIGASAAAGFSASLVDSLLGATVQARYRCPRCESLTEEPIHRACDGPADLVRGQMWMTNDTVNALATSVGAAIGMIFGTPIAAGHVRGGG